MKKDKSKECIKCENFVLDLDEVPCCFCEDKSNFKSKEMKSKFKEEDEKMTETMQIIKEIMDAKKVSQNKMAEELQVSYMTMNNWYHGKVNPRIDDVEKMLNYLGAKINICVE